LENYFFIILTFTDNIERYPHRKGMEDIPSYLANYNLDINTGSVIQSNIYDAIKFNSKEDANLFMNKARESMPDWEYEIADISKRIFGKKYPRFVYN
jgi:hypothetical protein